MTVLTVGDGGGKGSSKRSWSSLDGKVGLRCGQDLDSHGRLSLPQRPETFIPAHKSPFSRLSSNHSSARLSQRRKISFSSTSPPSAGHRAISRLLSQTGSMETRRHSDSGSCTSIIPGELSIIGIQMRGYMRSPSTQSAQTISYLITAMIPFRTTMLRLEQVLWVDGL